MKAYLFSVIYDGKKKKAVMRFYDPVSGKIVYVGDSTDHKPYLLTDASPEDVRTLAKELTSRIVRIHRVKRYDIVRDQHVEVTKVETSDPLAVGGGKKDLRTILAKAGFRVWEAKIKYYESYIYDRGLVPGMLYQIDGENIALERVDLPEEERKIVEEAFSEESDEVRNLALELVRILREPIPKMSYASLDIEVASPPLQMPSPSDPRKPVIAVAMMGSDNTKKVFLLRRRNSEVPSQMEDIKLMVFDEETDLLRAVSEEMRRYTVIYTFNGDNFDLPYLAKRAKVLGVGDLGIITERDRTLLRDGIHIDLYKLFSNRSIQVYVFKNAYLGYTLDEISEGILNEKKIDIGPERDIASLSPEKLAQYCFQDAKLTFLLGSSLNNNLLRIIFVFSRLAKMPVEDVARTGISQWIRGMIYASYRERKWLIPNKEDILQVRGSKIYSKALIKGKKYMGAIVLNPVPGVHFNVAVMDFASMYPSIIKKWNISFETMNCPHTDCKDNRPLEDLPHWICRRRLGIVPKMIGVLRDLRVRIYKKLAKSKNISKERREWYDVIQNSLKVLLNASYGVFGFEEFPLYSPPVAEMITALGRAAITSAVEEARKLGLKVIYGDTDSLFIENASKDLLNTLEKKVESKLGIDLELDKMYRYVVLPSIKKNYLGVTPNGHVDIKGLLGKKRNIPDIVKEAFFEVLKVLSEARTPEEVRECRKRIGEIVRGYVERLRKREFNLDEICFRATLNKKLSNYVKTTPQHVKAARLLEERLKMKVQPGEVISYVKVTGVDGVKPVELASVREVDVDKYVEIMRSTFQQIFDALDLDFDELISGKKMKTLEDFL